MWHVQSQQFAPWSEDGAQEVIKRVLCLRNFDNCLTLQELE